MSKILLNICLLEHAVGKPFYATDNAAGLDLTAGINSKILIKKNEYKLIPSGIKIEIPVGFEGQVRPRSGLALKHGLTVLNAPGTIDADYRGEIKVLIINFGLSNYTISPGMRIAQLIFAPVYKADLKFVKRLGSVSERGEKGFGSTGIESI